MPKPRKAIRPITKSISFPEDIVAQVDLHLFSPLEGRVPHGAWSRLLETLLRDFLSRLSKEQS